MRETGLRTGRIITLSASETITVDAGTIEIVPAWRFVLGEM